MDDTKQGKGHRLAMFLLGATLALGFALGSYMVSNSLVRMRQSDLIRVKGLSAVQVRSDAGTWSCNYWVRAADVKTAYESLEKSRAAIVTHLKSERVSDGEISVEPAEISIRYGRDDKGNATNVIEGYTLTQTVRVTSAEVDKIAGVSRSISQLLRQGIELRSISPSYTYSELEALKLDLMAKATQNGYQRAQVLADNSNGKIGQLSSASQGVFQITPVGSMETNDSGMFDTGSIDKSIRCVVTLEFHTQ